MAISFRSSGTLTAGTTDPTGAPGAAAGQLADDMLILLVLTKLATPPTATTPGNWTAPANNTGTGGAGAQGIDTGLVRVTLFNRVATADAEAMPTVDLSAAPNPSIVKILCYSKDASEVWDPVVCAIASDTSGSTTLYDPAASGTTIDLGVGDRLGWAHAINGDAGTPSPPGTLTVAGVTFGSLNGRTNDPTAQGQDARLLSGDTLYSSGAASGGPDASLSFTSANSSMAGVSVFFRLRVTAAPPAVLPSLVMAPPRRTR